MISVVIPIYGVEKYIERCAHSVLGQTFKDVEYIFVNDCTKDNSLSILSNVLKDYPNNNVTIISKKTNEGLPQARKTGVLASHGDYIIHFDSDDWVEPDCLEKMYNCAITENADIVIANYFENFTDCEKKKECPSVSSSIDGINLMLRAKLHSGVWNKLIKRDMYKGVIFPKANMHEDLVTMVQLFSKANSFCCMDDAFYHYNLTNSGSLTNNLESKRRAKDAYENLKMIESFIVQNNLIDCFASFSNFVNTFKGAMLLHKQTRNKQWLYSLFPLSKRYIFTECRLALWKKALLWGAYHHVMFLYPLIDITRNIVTKDDE